MSFRIPRRTFLRGLGGAGLGLPLFESLGCNTSSAPRDPAHDALGRARAKAVFPKRFVVIYTPNGNTALPDALDTNGTQLAALAPFASKMLLLKGLDLAACNQPPGEPHQQGMAWLTGRKLNEGNFVGGDGSLAGWGSGISVDQELATKMPLTMHKSLHFGVQSTAYGGTEVRTVMSYAGPDQPIGNETSPYTAFDLLFSQLGADPAGVERLRQRRKSVLDVVGKQYADISKKVSAADRQKLEQHLAAVREVEKKLDGPSVVLGGACQKPTVLEEGAEPVDLSDPASFPVIGKLHMDLLAMALACDLTRVATLQWSASTNNRPYPWLSYDDGSGPKPITDDEHSLGHQPDSATAAWGKLDVIRRWYFEQIAYLCAKLEAIPEGEGTMLDNTVILWGSEIARGNTHSHMDTPMLLIGSAGGYFKTGRYLSFGERPHNDLLVSILNAMGHEATTFGDPAFCTGPITELVG